ncbi:unnamed protein product [Lupinus luteus]|uniref:Uncharacterized protein n=1 Tax=Lupinus luteus TaxID=3873 RepID=A0AAV1Y8I5_LUPLU
MRLCPFHRVNERDNLRNGGDNVARFSINLVLEHWCRLWLTYTMVTTRNRDLSTIQVDPAPSTLHPPRQPSHQASRSHHTTPDPPPTTQHLLQMLERQERLIQQQANMIEELRQPKADTVGRPESHTEEVNHA